MTPSQTEAGGSFSVPMALAITGPALTIEFLFPYTVRFALHCLPSF
jgi:hypothetical protein